MSHLCSKSRDAVRPSRRDVVRGGLWSVPVVAAAAAVPRAAASQVPCRQVPADSAWTTSTVQGTGNGATNSWGSNAQGRYFQFQQDGTSAVPFVLRLRSNVTVVAGRTYRFTFRVQTRRGCVFNDPQNANTDFSGYIGGQTIVRRSSMSGNSHAVVPGMPACQAGFGTGEVVSYDYVAPSSGQVIYEMSFSTNVARGDNNDDYRVYPSISCL